MFKYMKKNADFYAEMKRRRHEIFGLNAKAIVTHLVGLLLLIWTQAAMFHHHRNATHADWDSPVWADASGYYMYLPCWIVYGGSEAANFPKDAGKNMGDGFKPKEGTPFMFTKYPSGVAFLSAPFYWVAHQLAGPFGFARDGFSPIYIWSFMFSTAFYGCLGLWALLLFLRRYFSLVVTIGVVLLLHSGTNLFYYMLKDIGYAHPFGFGLLALLLLCVRRFYDRPAWPRFLPIGVLMALLILLRPTNALMAVVIFAYDFDDWRPRLQFWLRRWPYLIYMAACLLLVGLPQMLFWKTVTGHWLAYSYGDEGFIYWYEPKIAFVLFAANNGWLAWSPLMMLPLWGLYLMRTQPNFRLYAWLPACALYLAAAWWSPNFGCSFGMRMMIDFYPLLAMPLAFALAYILSPWNQLTFHPNSVTISGSYAWLKLGLSTLLLLIIVLVYRENLYATYKYPGCWFHKDWDYQHYLMDYWRIDVIDKEP